MTPRIDELPEDLEIYLDGLDASVDGRGWGIRHQAAFDRMSLKIRIFPKLMAAIHLARGVMATCVFHEAAVRVLDNVLKTAEVKPCKP